MCENGGGFSNLDDVFRILDEGRAFSSREEGKRSALTDVGWVKKSRQRGNELSQRTQSNISWTSSFDRPKFAR